MHTELSQTTIKDLPGSTSLNVPLRWQSNNISKVTAQMSQTQCMKSVCVVDCDWSKPGGKLVCGFKQTLRWGSRKERVKWMKRNKSHKRTWSLCIWSLISVSFTGDLWYIEFSVWTRLSSRENKPGQVQYWHTSFTDQENMKGMEPDILNIL